MNKAERTKQFIIEQAATIVNEKGISGTSIDDILKAAKIAKASLYTYFDSKEDLCYASVDYLLDRLTEKRDAYLEKHNSAKGKIFAVLDMNKNPLNFLIEGGCPIVNLSTEADDTSKVVAKKVRTVVSAYLKLYTEILNGGINSGEFSEHLNAEEYAMKMFTCIEGASAISRIMNSTKPMQLITKSLKKELNAYEMVQNMSSTE